MKKILIAALLVTSAFSALADKPLTLIVAYPPGGDTDVLARMFGVKLSERLRRPVIVENRVGASGALGTIHAMNAKPDGDTILIAPSTFVTAPLIDPKIAKYDALTDFRPIMQITQHSMFAVINASTGIKTAKELITATNAGRISTYATPGTGTPMHILGEMFKHATKTDLTHIPFKGNAQVVTNVLGNQVPLTWITLLPVIQHVDAGKMNIIGVAGSKRSPFYPEVPTLAEQGIKGVEVDSWLGFLAPANTPNDVVRELNANLNDIMRSTEFQEKFKALALIPVGGPPSVFAETIKRDTAKFKRVLKEVEVKSE